MARRKKQTNYQRLDRTVVALARRDQKLRALIDSSIEENGRRICRASALAQVLGYESIQAFERCINEAKITAGNASVPIDTNFIDIEQTLFDGKPQKDMLPAELRILPLSVKLPRDYGVHRPP
jgi:hypothetical protein